MAIGAKNAALSVFPSPDRLMTRLNRRSARSGGDIDEMSGTASPRAPGRLIAARVPSGSSLASRDSWIADSAISAPKPTIGSPHRSTGGHGLGVRAAARPLIVRPQRWQNRASGMSCVPQAVQNGACEAAGASLTATSGLLGGDCLS
ncbi:hypothetical protein BH23GEM2_BH23GEM2_06430 [soil metagenome]